MDRAALDETIQLVIARLTGSSDAPTPASLTFLLRCYGLFDRGDIQAALEPSLARALDVQAGARTIDERASWLVMFADALPLSHDARVQNAVAALVSALRDEWGKSLEIGCLSRSIEACLHASRVVDAKSLAADAIDELERIIAAAYKPGAGLSIAQGKPRSLADHVATAGALLAAFGLSGRLPYSMLAEELMQVVRRTSWDERAGCFGSADRATAEMFQVNCSAARVLCGLAALHDDPGYVAAAVINRDALYVEDARRILEAHHNAVRFSGLDPGVYGLSLLEWLQRGA
jgi:hypothetical protein